MNVNAGALDGILAGVKRQIEQKWQRLRRANEEAAEFGAKTAQSYTRSRPGSTTGKAGRVDTGAMVAALRHRSVSFDSSLIRSQYGFVDEFDLYMKLQTVTGFRHNRSGRYIAPTFALRDSIEPTRAYAKQAGRDAV